jgi:chitinase
LTGGRSKAACCTVQKAPPRPASCSADLCKLLPGYCPNDNDDESADDYTKRDFALFDTNNSASWRALEKRGSGDTYYVDIGNNVGIRIIALAYPAIAELFGVENASQVLRRFFRLILGYCTGPSIQEGTIPPGDSPPGLTGLQAEHPIDVSITSLNRDMIEY